MMEASGSCLEDIDLHEDQVPLKETFDRNDNNDDETYMPPFKSSPALTFVRGCRAVVQNMFGSNGGKASKAMVNYVRFLKRFRWIIILAYVGIIILCGNFVGKLFGATSSKLTGIAGSESTIVMDYLHQINEQKKNNSAAHQEEPADSSIVFIIQTSDRTPILNNDIKSWTSNLVTQFDDIPHSKETIVSVNYYYGKILPDLVKSFDKLIGGRIKNIEAAAKSIFLSRTEDYMTDDGQSTVMLLLVDVRSEHHKLEVEKIIDLVLDSPPTYKHGNITTYATGTQVMYGDILKGTIEDVENIHTITVPIVFLVFAMMLRSPRLLVLPILGIMASMLISFALLYAIALHTTVVAFAPSLVLSVILAMSIDYSLFLLSRYREQLFDGATSEESVLEVINTAGYTCLVSGMTLATCFMGLFFIDEVMLKSLGMGSCVAVIVVVIVNLTLIPAIILAFPKFFAASAVPRSECKEQLRKLFQKCRMCFRCCFRSSINDARPLDSVETPMLPSEFNDEADDGGLIVLSSEYSDIILDNFLKDEDDAKLLHLSKEGGEVYAMAQVNPEQKSELNDLDYEQYEVAEKKPAVYEASSCSKARRGYMKFKLAVFDDEYSDGSVSFNPSFDFNETERAAMASWWFKLGKFSVNNALFIVLTIFLLTVPALYCVSKMNLSNNVKEFAPRTFQSYAAYELLEKAYTTSMMYPVIIGIKPPEHIPINDMKVYEAAYHLVKNVIHPLNHTKDIDTRGSHYYGLVYDQIPKTTPAYYGLAVEACHQRPAQVFEFCAQINSLYNDYTSIAGQFTTISLVPYSVDLFMPSGGSFIDLMRSTIHAATTDPASPLFNYVVSVGGDAVVEHDIVNSVYGQFPVAIAMTMLMVFIIISVSFKSLVLPLRSILSISVTIVWAFGASVLVYDYGILAWMGLPGLSEVTISWVSPVMVFGVAVGLSLDYEIFLLERIVEYRIRGLATKECIVMGFTMSASIITAAGTVMAIAFGGLLFCGEATLNQLGFLLVTVVFVDTLFVRCLFAPALAALLGEWNWWPRKFEV